MRCAALLLGLCIVVEIEGCAIIDPDAHADALAAPAHLQRQQVDADGFVLTAFSRISAPDKPLRVYIEGDGLAWLSRTQPSLDPTPREATGLALAAADPAPNVVYLARPCQFTPMSMNPRCAIPYWTARRFAPEVVRSMNSAVSHFAALTPGQPVELVGYSGGGAIAALIAADRTDVRSLRTVAGNLDDEFVNQLHHVSPMPESENPIDFASRLSGLPQIHFSGSTDTTVPPTVAQRFVAATGPACARAIVVDDIAHDGDWSRQWPALLDVMPSCSTSVSRRTPE
jgi:hypothetical protein